FSSGFNVTEIVSDSLVIVGAVWSDVTLSTMLNTINPTSDKRNSPMTAILNLLIVHAPSSHSPFQTESCGTVLFSLHCRYSADSRQTGYPGIPRNTHH